MKNIKKTIILIFIVLLLLIFILLLDYARLNISYIIHKNNYTESFNVQGNTLNYVPQGLCYSKKYNVALQTSYNSKHNVSMLYVINFETGKLIKQLELIETDDSINTNHVGGITTDENTVWISNDYEINEYNLDEAINTKNKSIKSKKDSELINRGDFCTYKDNTLWIGSFHIDFFSLFCVMQLNFIT